MKLVEKKFTFENDYWVHRNLVLCNDQIEELFFVPDNVMSIWVSLHSRPTTNRYKATIERDCNGFVELQVKDYSNAMVDNGAFETIFEKFIGKTVYVQVEYEE